MGCGTSGLKDCNKSGQSVNDTNVNSTKIDNNEQHVPPSNQTVACTVNDMNSTLNDNQQNELKEQLEHDNDNTPSVSVIVEETTSVLTSHDRDDADDADDADDGDGDNEKQFNTSNNHQSNTIN